MKNQKRIEIEIDSETERKRKRKRKEEQEDTTKCVLCPRGLRRLITIEIEI